MADKTRFSRLFEPVRLGNLDLRNRIVMAPMGIAAKDYTATQPMKDYFAARAKGGAGAIMVGGIMVDYPEGAGHLESMLINEDRTIPGFAQLAEAVHRHGAKIVLQLNHYGPAANVDLVHVQPVAASAVSRTPSWAHPRYWVPRELSLGEIEKLVGQFASAARRAKEAGCDGVEIDAALRYLINSFLSPAFNQRQDQYGGDLKNRARFLLEIAKATRELVGPDYPVWCRINSEERQTKGGITLDMSRELAPMLEEAGIDVIDVALQLPHSLEYGPGFNAGEAAEIKKTVGIPVMAGGRVDVWMGERLLREGKADLICIGRALIADPELPNKAASGNTDDITPCVSCNSCLAPQRACTVNAAREKEADYEIKPVDTPRKVLVVGGGPGGMEAARVAALRGHKVALYEKGYQLGGQLIPAGLLRSEYVEFLRYLKSQMEKLGVEVHLKREVSPELIAEINPDAVVLATGAASALPQIPGMDRKNVLSSGGMQRMMSGQGGGTLLWSFGAALMRGKAGYNIMRRVFLSWAPFGKKVVVMGIGLGGCEMADFLTGKGKQVTMVDTREDLAFGEGPMTVLRTFWKDRVLKRGGVILPKVKYVEVNGEGLVIEKDGERQTLPADTVIFAADYRPNAELAESLKNASREVHLVGDCAEPAGILEAIRDGSRVGRLV